MIGNLLKMKFKWKKFKSIYELLFSDKQKTLSPHTTLSPLSPYFNLTEDIVKPIGLELYNEEEFTDKEIQMIEDQTRKQIKEIDPLFLGDKDRKVYIVY